VYHNELRNKRDYFHPFLPKIVSELMRYFNDIEKNGVSVLATEEKKEGGFNITTKRIMIEIVFGTIRHREFILSPNR